MNKLPFKKVLFMSNFTIDMGDPNFRTGAYMKYLEPLAQTLAKNNSLDIKFLLSKHIYEAIKREAKSSSISDQNSFIVDYQHHVDIFGFGDWFIKKSYNQSFSSEEQAYIYGYFKMLFNGWKPDLILCWEFPTSIFRTMFPDALVVDLMPGLFMRPPYPRTISFDPVGLYKDSVYGTADLSKLKAADAEIESYYQLRHYYELFYEENAVKSFVLSQLRNADTFKQFLLVPLQITPYFGFYENCHYDSQFEFLFDVLKNTPADVGVIATQYVGSLVQEKAINDKNIDYLHSNFNNFLYSKDFEKIDNISQFIVPWADATCSISSTIGLQTKFYNRRLISPSRSHLKYLADQTDLKTHHALAPNNEHIMSIMMSRQVFLEERLLNEPEYLTSILREWALNKMAGKAGMNLLDNRNLIKLSKENPLHYRVASSPQVAIKQLGKLGLSSIRAENNDLTGLVKAVREAAVVSFDVFDTLLCRAVFKPEDVFLMMQKELLSNSRFTYIPRHIAKSFAQLRAGVERQLRRDRDAVLAANASTDTREEITIREVYHALLDRFGGNPKDAGKLIDLEESMEWSVLRERPVGKFLFHEALQAGKPIWVISDFIHDEAFVARALEEAGFTGYTKLYVSSKVGKKKHSGDLFKHVAEEMNVDTSTVLHIGDNPIGDLGKAAESGWNPIRISSARERALQIFKHRALSPAIIDKSFFLRTTLSLFAEEFYQIKAFRHGDAESDHTHDRGIVENGVEFGFLALGPLMYSFSEWIIKQAREKNCRSIVFFARDCYLPYRIVGKILQERGQQEQINVHYIATSRRGLMGMNLQKPEDFLEARIDDFAKQNSLAALLVRRFGLDPALIPQSILDRWSVPDLDTPISQLTPAAIYGVVFEHVSENWEEVTEPFRKRREVYKKYLLEQGIDLTQSALGVDFGYKGSTHRMIDFMFKGGLHPAFFMTFADEFGQDPIPNAESFYLRNVNPVYKNDIMLNYNLIIETLVNDATGSLIEVTEYESGIRMIKEELGSTEHLSKINGIHRGVLLFADRWLECFKDKPELATLEINSAEYILAQILRKPTRREAEILRGLVFDNAFAGHNKRYILAPSEDAPINDSIWKEGHKALYHSVLQAKQAKPPEAAAPTKAAITNGGSKSEGTKPSPAASIDKKPAVKAKEPPKAPIEVKVSKKVDKPQETVIKVVKDSIEINGTSYPKSLEVLRNLYRDTFVEVIAALAKRSPSREAKADYIKMIENNQSKLFIAAKLLQDHGGIANANISGSDKMNAYKYLMLKK